MFIKWLLPCWHTQQQQLTGVLQQQNTETGTGTGITQAALDALLIEVLFSKICTETKLNSFVFKNEQELSLSVFTQAGSVQNDRIHRRLRPLVVNMCIGVDGWMEHKVNPLVTAKCIETIK